MQLVVDALVFAIHKHGSQQRKYTGDPYVTHCADVMEIVRNLYPAASPEMLAAAVLHDVIEDTDTTREQVERAFGGLVAVYVDWLTDYQTHADGNRETRMANYREKLSRAPDVVQSIKVADMIDNSNSIIEHDPNFAKVYMREKEALLKVLTRAHPRLIAWAKGYIDRFNKLEGKK